MNQELRRKVQKLLKYRHILEIELLNVLKIIQEAIKNKKRKVIVENYIRIFFPEKDFFKNGEIYQMAKKATNIEKICEELEQWLDLLSKRHDEVIHKARN